MTRIPYAPRHDRIVQSAKPSSLIILIDGTLMKSTWRKHLVICLVLGLLAVPIYYLDQALLGPVRGGGNWITLDFRG